jgi:hypothetical protein
MSDEAKDDGPVWILIALLAAGGVLVGIYFFRGGKWPW